MPNKQRPEENSYADIDMEAVKPLMMPPEDVPEKRHDPAFTKLEQALDEMPRQIRTFSESMKKRYAEKALSVDVDDDLCRRYQKLRNDTKNDALVYFKAILPVIEVVITEIENVFDHFVNLKKYELKSQFNGMLEELQNCRQLCEMAKLMNEETMTILKRREDKALEIVQEIRELQEEYERKQVQMETSAEFKRKMAIGFSFVPGINLIVAPALFLAANHDKKEAIVQGKQAQAKQAAAVAVTETLIPALESFIKALGTTAGFLAEMENEIIKCHGNGERWMEGKPMELLLNLMKMNADNIRRKCKEFRKILPSVKSDFQSICGSDPEGSEDEEIDHEYVFKRLQKMMEFTHGLHKKPKHIIENFQMLMYTERKLANPGARENFQSYV